MNNSFVDKAKEEIKNPKILSILAARRAGQLARGARPMVKCKSENHLDTALQEIVEGKLTYECPHNLDNF